MTDSKRDDLIWQTAVGWVMREHEEPLDPVAHNALLTWLKDNPAHRAAYEEAARLWLLTGLIPPSEDASEIDPPIQSSEPSPGD